MIFAKNRENKEKGGKIGTKNCFFEFIRNAIRINADSRQRNKITKWFILNDLSYFFDFEESAFI